MATKDDEQRLLELAEKIKKLEAKKKQLEFRTREKERKERTRNLIQIGAIIQSVNLKVFGSKYDLEIFKKYLLDTMEGQELLNKFADYRQYQLRAECNNLDKEIKDTK